MITGFYGGKFLPMHKGHVYCIDTAARQCDYVIVIMFVGGDDELRVLSHQKEKMLGVEARTAQLKHICNLYSNVECCVIDVTDLKLPDGSEDWDAETPLVRRIIPHMDFVYSSEPSYGAYFARAYPEAKHIIVDAKRITYPISSTLIRAMNEVDRKNWMV